MSSAKRMKRAVPRGAVVCVAVVVWLFTAASALAGPVYSLGGYVGGEEGHSGEEFAKGPDGLALDPASGDVYVADGGNRRIQQFGAEITPNFLAAWGWEVNEGGSETFEICTEASKCQRGAEGNGPGEFGGGSSGDEATGAAVDPVNHDVYVADSANNRVESFEAAGKFLHQFDGTEIDGAPAAKPAPEGLSYPTGIAADPAGHIYVEDMGHDVIDRFGATGEYECQISGTTPGSATECDLAGSRTSGATEGFSLGSAEGAGLAVDASGDVYLADTGNNVVDEFSSSGAFVRSFGQGVLSSPQAVSVDEAGDVFALSGENTVYEFNATGANIGEFTMHTPNGTLGNIDALAVTPDGNRVYASNRTPFEKKLLLYGRFPVVGTDAAATPALGDATLHGTVNPAGLPVEACEFEWGQGGPGGAFEHAVPCEQSPAQIGAGEEPMQVSAELSGLMPFGLYHYRVVARNQAGPAYGTDTALLASVDVFGFQLGGLNALEINASDPNAKEPTIVENGWQVANPAAPDSQAGSHPFAVTTRFLVNTESDDNLPPAMAPKDYYVNIPAGFAGSVAKIPRCKMSELTLLFEKGAPAGCPTASQVGVVRVFEPNSSTGRVEEQVLRAVYNMVPPPGVPAELAFAVGITAEPVLVQVRSDGDYGVTAKVANVSEELQIAGSELTLWGVPANPAHDKERFLPSLGTGLGFPGNEEGGPLPAGAPEVPFLTNPTRCGPVEEAAIMADSWLHPGKLASDGRPVPGSENWVTVHAQMYPNGITGCGKLTFQPQIEVKPTTTVADSPMGMTVDLKVPQNEGPNNFATPALKNATVTLPAGVAISPSAGNGLEGCTLEQIKLHSEAQPECPNAAQIGKLELTTPLLPEPLAGRIYLSSQHSGNVFHMFLVIEGQGVLVKLEGSVEANTITGQLVSTFSENPQLPFSDLKLTFYGGSNAALSSPQQCGTYTTAAELEPWSHYEADGDPTGTPNAAPAIQPFTIASGCGNGFAPSLSAGVSDPVAGAYSPFELSFSRKDGEQDLSGLQVKMPLGLVGKLAGVGECSGVELDAAEHSTGTAEQADPSCPASSEVGTVEAGAGPGSSPFFLPGKAYLTGPYEGAPYGLAVVVPVLAGPFDLGTVVVRSRIEIDPHTAQVTVTSDPFPQILDGIPLQMRRVDIHVSRPEFTYNPTTCEPTQITGTLTSVSGTQHAVSSRFQVGDCGSLPFKPTFSVYTHAGHTRRNGAYLRVKVTSGLHQTNIKSVFVELPKVLPSRDETLKLACSAKQFAENPAGCPAGSRVGAAVAHTPILGTPLTGPAIFVSHGGAAFPDLDVVLQGGGVTVDLEGTTNIVKGITSSDFKAVPDVPVSSFELTLPPSSHSALAAEGNLCFKTVRKGKRKVKQAVKLIMPTTISGHDGAQIKQSTAIHVEGCAKKAGRKGSSKKKK
jgi:DNA-binding beta-propeller fold protein YncE